MKKYSCWWPGCEYSTTSRSKIDMHHVTPKELDPRSNNKVTVSLCKTHHALIYHPDTKSGQHSIKSDESLAIMTLPKTDKGLSVLYEDMSGNRIIYYTRTGEFGSFD
jgi:hypothetical protein